MRKTSVIITRRKVRDWLDKVFGKTLTVPLRILASLSILGVCGVIAFCIYIQFIYGMTNGSDFMEALRGRELDASMVSSIEVVEPPLGHTPFTAKEYDGLPRQAQITDRARIERILSILKDAGHESIQKNHSVSHPVNTYHAYLKVNVQGGFYWIYCDIYRDGNSSILHLDANTRNATNPNGAVAYHLGDFSDLISVLATRPDTEQDIAPSDR